MSIDLGTCTPEALAQWLLQHRFVSVADHQQQQGSCSGAEMEVTEFLLHAVSSLPNAQAISDQLVRQQQEEEDHGGYDDDDGGGDDEAQEETTTLSNSLGAPLVLTVSNPDTVTDATSSSADAAALSLSLLVPRVKAQVTFYTAGIRVQDKNDDSFQLTTGSVAHLLIFPKPEDCHRTLQRRSSISNSSSNNNNKAKQHKIPSADMLLLVLHPESVVLYKTKKLTQVCFQLPSFRPSWSSSSSNSSSSEEEDTTDDHSVQWMRVLMNLLGLDATNVVRVRNPATTTTTTTDYQFVSHHDDQVSSTTDAMPFVSCHLHVHDGVLFPLNVGILFYKPPRFIPKHLLQSIACGRGGGSSTSRFVDLTVTLHPTNDDDDDKTTVLEFTNIHRSELTVLNAYIHDTLIPAMQRDAKESANNDKDQVQEEEKEVLAEEDEEEARPSKRSAGKRKAAQVGLAMTKRMQIASDQDDDSDEDDAYEDDANESEASSDDDDDNDDDNDDDEAVVEDMNDQGGGDSETESEQEDEET